MSTLNELHPHLDGRRLTTEKEIKVRIPMDQHIKLHTLKVLQGQSISLTVKTALENYFREVEAERAEEQARRRLDAWGPAPGPAPGADHAPPL